VFTGIIEEMGTVLSIKKGSRAHVLQIKGQVVLGDMKTGDSVAVNGVCLTVSGLGGNAFTADIMNETLGRSGLGGLRSGDRVNLERAMAANGRFGGHMVSGHIDGTGAIAQIRRDGNALWYTISAPPQVMGYIVEKGSVAIDGISLTVATLARDSFSVSVIPHTAKSTVLGCKASGDSVNLETDMVAKYIKKYLEDGRDEAPAKSTMTAEFLIGAGF